MHECIFLSFFSLESELSADLVEGAECAHSVGGLLSFPRGTLPQSSGGMFLCLLLGRQQLPFAGYGATAAARIHITSV